MCTQKEINRFSQAERERFFESSNRRIKQRAFRHNRAIAQQLQELGVTDDEDER